MPHISKRGELLPASPIRRLAPLAAEAEKRGLKVYRLNIGQPDLPTPQEAFKALEKIDTKVMAYTPSEGVISLRNKFVEYYKRYDIEVTPADIVVTVGGSEAVQMAFMACLDPGDEIIIPEPSYANYFTFARLSGAKIVTIPSHIENGFALPPIEEFERLITPRTRAILICNPNNPTGYVYTPEEMNKVRDLVRKHDLWLFSDEVYREFCYTDYPVISAMQLEGIQNQVVMIDSVSKRYNECGIRIGCLVTRNEKLRHQIMKFAQARLSPPMLGQIVAEASIDTPQSYLEAVHDEYVKRRDFLIAGINSIEGCFTPTPMGAFYTVARLPVDNADIFCKWCLNDFSYNGATVFMAPASGFYSVPGMGENEVRMAYVLCVEELDEALKVLAEALKAYPGRTF